MLSIACGLVVLTWLIDSPANEVPDPLTGAIFSIPWYAHLHLWAFVSNVTPLIQAVSQQAYLLTEKGLTADNLQQSLLPPKPFAMLLPASH